MSWETLLHAGSLVLLTIVTLAAISVILRTLRNGVPPMPSSARAKARLIALLRELQPNPCCTAIELGSGWGTLGLSLSRAMPAATVIGYENSPVPFWFGLAAARVLRADNLHLMRRNFHTVSLRDADLLYCYLSPQAMALLRPKLETELRSGTLVISSTFAVPTWTPTRVAVVADIYRTPIYVYVAGESQSGRRAVVSRSPAR